MPDEDPAAKASAVASPERQPLAGIRVVDLTHLVAGPYCSMLLADAGAEVVKVEPVDGEVARARGVVRRSATGEALSAYFLAVNRGKRSVALDLKTESGRRDLWKLIADSDVLIHNFRRGVLERLGFGYPEVHERNPALVFASIIGFRDEDTARRQRSGYAIIAEAESGVASHCVDQSGRPVWYGFPLGDFVAGLTAYGAITTALVGRSTTGAGSYLPISMVGALLSMNAASVAAHEIDGPRGVQVAKDTAPYGYFRTRDGFVVIAIVTDKFWANLCHVMGRPELIDNPRYQMASVRNSHLGEVDGLVEAWTMNLTRDECIRLLTEGSVPCGRVNDTSDLMEDDELARLGYLITTDDGLGGSARLPANPMGFSAPISRVPRFNEDRGLLDNRDGETTAGSVNGS